MTADHGTVMRLAGTASRTVARSRRANHAVPRGRDHQYKEKPVQTTRRLAVLSLVASALFGLQMPAAQQAHADNVGSTNGCGVQANTSNADPAFNCVSFGNNTAHAVRFYNLDRWPESANALRHSFQFIYNGLTEINIYETTTDTAPDVAAMDNDYGNNGIAAWVDCPAANTGIGTRNASPETRWCRGQYLRFNGNAVVRNDYFATGLRTEFLACHELGHTIGLRHRNVDGSCLATFGAGALRQETLAPHDRLHVNAWY